MNELTFAQNLIGTVKMSADSITHGLKVVGGEDMQAGLIKLIDTGYNIGFKKGAEAYYGQGVYEGYIHGWEERGNANTLTGVAIGIGVSALASFIGYKIYKRQKTKTDTVDAKFTEINQTEELDVSNNDTLVEITPKEKDFSYE